jgi:hypothetical protein
VGRFDIGHIERIDAEKEVAAGRGYLQDFALYGLVAVLLIVQIGGGMAMNSLAFVGLEVGKAVQFGRATLGACIGIAFLGMAAGAAESQPTVAS